MLVLVRGLCLWLRYADGGLFLGLGDLVEGVGEEEVRMNVCLELVFVLALVLVFFLDVVERRIRKWENVIVLLLVREEV